MAALNQPIVCPVLIGRSAATGALEELMTQVAAGRGQTALVSGEAGIGKSRLLATIAESAQSRGWQVLRANCFEQDRRFAYAALTDLLRNLITDEEARGLIAPLSADLSRLAPELGRPVDGVEPEQEQRNIFAALLQVLSGLVGRAPCLLLVEDLHWSDENSLDFWLTLSRRAQTLPLLLLATYRSDEVGPPLRRFLAELDRGRLALELPLNRLSLSDVDAMLKAILAQSRSTRAEFLQALHKLTDGNPFFVEEVLRSVLGEQRTADLEALRLADSQVPRSVQEAVQRRTMELSAEAQEVIRLAAVAGTRFDFELLKTISGRSETELLAIVRELIAQQLVVEETEERFAFRHALTREAIRAGLLARERRALHKRIAEAMQDLYAGEPERHAEDLAYHFYESEDWQQALGYLETAGQRALDVYAPGVAVEHLSRAIDADGRLGGERGGRLRLRRAAAYDALGDFEHARADYEEAITDAAARNEDAARIEGLLALGLLWASRDYERAREYYEQAVGLARASGDQVWLARALNRLGNWHSNRGHYNESRRHQDEALAIFRSLNDQRGLAETLDVMGMTGMLGGRMEDSNRFFTEAAQAFEALDDKRGMITPLATMSSLTGTYQSNMLKPPDSLAGGTARVERALVLANETGSPTFISYCHWQLCFILGPQGWFDRALAHGHEALSLAEQAEHLQWTVAAHNALGSVYDDLLQPEEAIRHLQTALRMAEELASEIWIEQSVCSLTLALIRVGRVDEVATLLRGRHSTSEGADQTFTDLWLRTAQMRLALAEGQYEAVLKDIEALRQVLETGDAAAHMEALALWGLGRQAEALAVLDQVIEMAERRGNLTLAWRAWAQKSGWLLALDRRDEARQAADSAIAGIDLIAGRMSDEAARDEFTSRAMLELPAAFRRRSVRQRPADALTSREAEIAALIARGLSNKAIADELVLSVRTVETHVANAMSKLGLASRAQLAAWAVGQGLTSGSSS